MHVKKIQSDFPAKNVAGFGMKLRTLGAAVSVGTIMAMAGSAEAASCYDLWYKRNAIFDDNGFCFSSKLGRETFDNSDCWTRNPKLSSYERKVVAKIRKSEAIKGCRVNN